LSDKGIKLYFFKGNHDMWVFDYFKKEFGLRIIDNELIIERNGKRFFIHHGDGLGAGDTSYKLLKKVFRSTFCQWLFARIHPNLGIGIANYWSSKSRLAANNQCWTPTEEIEKAWAENTYANIQGQFGKFDYFVMGHRHSPFNILLAEGVRYVNTGEWVNNSCYAVFDGETMELKKWS
ncbi:UDP-2,3-diacylglucosamine diphosphatase, partial [Pseudoxanthomonas sp. SGD-10]